MRLKRRQSLCRNNMEGIQLVCVIAQIFFQTTATPYMPQVYEYNFGYIVAKQLPEAFAGAPPMIEVISTTSSLPFKFERVQLSLDGHNCQDSKTVSVEPEKLSADIDIQWTITAEPLIIPN